MSRRSARKASSSLSYSCARSMSRRAPMNAFDDFSCIITSKQTVNMPVVEVKFGNDDNEVQGDTLLGELPITFQTDSSGSWNIELDATKLTPDALGTNAFNVIYNTCSGERTARYRYGLGFAITWQTPIHNDIFSSHRRMRHASVCMAPRTTRSTSVKCARCAWIPISNSSTKTSAMTIAAPITKWSV